MRIRAPYVAALLAACLASSAAIAGDPPLVSLGLGGTDILNQQTRTAADVRLEYRSGISLIPAFEQYIKVKPFAGLELTSRTSGWAGAGIVLEIPLSQHWVLTPSFAPGIYERGRGKNLGSFVEFRSQFEGGYVFDNQVRLVASIGHTSNAGLTKRNPGTEAGVVSLQIPLSTVFSR